MEGIQDHFDISRIIGIRIVDKQKASYKWLPKKQKTAFFGLIKRNSWHSEGFYQYGSYYECYESGCWDSYSYSKESLIESGYLVDEENVVWNRPCATVYLEYKREVIKRFDTHQDALNWATGLKMKSGKTFEIIKYEF
jgi:hypothetical protein